MAETQTAAALHLTKDQRDSPLAGLRSDNIDLPKPAAPIPLQHPHPLPLQLRTGQILTAHTYLFLRLRCHHRATPEPKHAYGGLESCGLTETCGHPAVMSCGNYRGIDPQRAALSVAPAATINGRIRYQRNGPASPTSDAGRCW